MAENQKNSDEIPIVLEFGGGAELLFQKKKRHEIFLKAKNSPWTIKNLLEFIKENLISSRPEFLIENSSVRPGILVLVNDTDWELVGTLDYQIQPNDNITFISTLHGG